MHSSDAAEYGGAVYELAAGRDDEIISGHVVRDIAFDVELDDALFSLEPPAGYALKTAAPPAPIEEKDVLEFMRIVAEHGHGAFPDRMPQFAHGSKEEFARLTRAQQAVRQRSGAAPEEVKLVEAMDSWYAKGLPGPGPMHVFITQQAAPGSWKYLGKGVKLGDKDRIICWYRPSGSRTYRVIRGDLSARGRRGRRPADPGCALARRRGSPFARLRCPRGPTAARAETSRMHIAPT